MRKILLKILGVFLALASLSLICYPFISNYLMSLNQESEISSYQDKVKNESEDKISAERKRVMEYNNKFHTQVVLTDPFDPTQVIQTDYEYENLMNFYDDGIMGSVEIPKIKLNLPIYHGTSDDVLIKGVGHLQNTSMPIGGIGTHAVLTGHTGIASAKLFTDLNLLEVGDVFFVNTLGEKMAYKIDKILVVLPTQTDELRVDEEHDYVTLVTCTPYGINSHRLFVRGTRIDYKEAEKIEQEQAPMSSSDSTWMREYKRALFAGAVILIVIIVLFFVIRVVLKRRRKHKTSIGEE